MPETIFKVHALPLQVSPMKSVTHLSTQLWKDQINRYPQVNFESAEKFDSLRNSIHEASQRRKSFIPLYGIKRAIAKPQRRVCDSKIKLTTFQTVCTFIAGTMASFSAIYTSDSIAAQSETLKEKLSQSDSNIGWLSSIVFLPSLFMSMIVSPLVDKKGPIYCGFLFNIIADVLILIMPFVWKNYYALLFVRLLFGFVNEPCSLVQSALVSRFLPPHLESLGLGGCMAIATSSGLISFFVVPVILGDNPSDSKISLTFWLNVFVAAGVLVIYTLSTIPLIKIERRLKQASNEIIIEEHTRQTQRYSLASSVRSSCSNDQQVFSNPDFIL